MNVPIWTMIGAMRQKAVLLAFLLCASSVVHAQLAAPPRPQGTYDKSVAFGLSYGSVNQRDADFWGWSLELGRQLQGPWIGAVSIMWDRETQRVPAAADQKTDSLTAAATITYAITERFALTTGLGKGFADTANPSRSMKFTNGDLATGIVFGISTPGLRHFTRDSIGFSFAYEYNFDLDETSISFDVSFGWSF